MRVLLVEHHRPLSRVLRRALQEEGYQVEVASDAEEADAQVMTAGFDLVILNLAQFRAIGHALLERWRHAGLTARVLVLTAPPADGPKSEALAPGASDYLVIPFRLEELLARLRAAASRPVRSEC